MDCIRYDEPSNQPLSRSNSYDVPLFMNSESWPAALGEVVVELPFPPKKLILPLLLDRDDGPEEPSVRWDSKTRGELLPPIVLP